MSTIIADRHSLTMGADRLASDGSLRCYATKIRKITISSVPEKDSMLRSGMEALVGIAENLMAKRAIFEWVRQGMASNFPSNLAGSGVSTLILTSEALYTVDDKGYVFEEEDYEYYAIGSGAKIGMAALYLGHTLQEALAVSHRFDMYTGDTYDILSLK